MKSMFMISILDFLQRQCRGKGIFVDNQNKVDKLPLKVPASNFEQLEKLN